MQRFHGLALVGVSLMSAAPSPRVVLPPEEKQTIRPVVSLVLASLDDELVAASFGTTATPWVVTVPESSGAWQAVASGFARALHGRAPLPDDVRLERLTFKAPVRRNDTLFTGYRRSSAHLCGGIWVEDAHTVEVASKLQGTRGVESWAAATVIRRRDEPVAPCGDRPASQESKLTTTTPTVASTSPESALVKSVLKHLRGYLVNTLLDSVPQAWVVTVPDTNLMVWQYVRSGIERWLNVRAEGPDDTNRSRVSLQAPRAVGETMEFVITTSGHRRCGDGSWVGSVDTFREIAVRTEAGLWQVQKGSATAGDGMCRN